MKKVSAPAAEQQPRRQPAQGTGPVFIDNISFTPGAEPKKSVANTSNKASINVKGPAVHSNNSEDGIENLSELRFKYAILLNTPVEDLTDAKLLEFIDDWYGTRYRLGGSDKTGIDCSAFVQSFISSMYGLSLARTCKEQYSQTRRIKKSNLEEGDLVFFKTRGKSISHVGVYLRNNKFIHASTSGGVMISDLSEDYFDKRYAGAGRL